MTGTPDAPPDALVIGAGPAGLMAADMLSQAGCHVIIAEAKPSPARKFLMAGKSGLNLTKDEAPAAFQATIACPQLGPALAAFGPAQVADWARALGIPLFTGSSGRVFPVGMKASPLLRAWLAALAARHVELRTRWLWTGWTSAGRPRFLTPDGPQTLSPRVTVLALGGASWPRLGSDAAWVAPLRSAGVTIHDFRPANAGIRVNWSPRLMALAGQPLKTLAFLTPGHSARGEAIITRAGLEGGGVYAVSAAVRDGAPLALDLLPDLSADQIAARLARARPGDSLGNTLRKALRLDPLKIALLNECARPLPAGSALAALIKHLPVPHTGVTGLDRAISSAGGIAWPSVTDALELRAIPGTFVCGEMLDWEAPTGGYLLTACLATGRWAGLAAARSALPTPPPPAGHP